jgi:hypothetical protein
MQLDRYEIVPAGDQWAVQLNTNVLWTFPERAKAIRAAIEAAHLSGESGNAAEVLTHGEDGEIVPLFVFGRDAYSAEA